MNHNNIFGSGAYSPLVGPSKITLTTSWSEVEFSPNLLLMPVSLCLGLMGQGDPFPKNPEFADVHGL